MHGIHNHQQNHQTGRRYQEEVKQICQKEDYSQTKPRKIIWFGFGTMFCGFTNINKLFNFLSVEIKNLRCGMVTTETEKGNIWYQ